MNAHPFDEPRLYGAAFDEPRLYIAVDVCEIACVSVYGLCPDADGAHDRTFIWDEKARERDDDVLCDSRADALVRAKRYASIVAYKRGCDWGTNA